MAAEQWMEVYRAYESDELATEIASLKKSVQGGFSSQGSGSVQHQRDLAELRDRLQAATRVKNERANRNNGSGMRGQVDFSRRNGWEGL